MITPDSLPQLLPDGAPIPSDPVYKLALWCLSGTEEDPGPMFTTSCSATTLSHQGGQRHVVQV